MKNKEWKEVRLGDVLKYINDKISIQKINVNNYISTENMLPNFGSVIQASNIPRVSKVNRFDRNDILLSNIRPYFKKIYYTNENGGCSNDVLVLRCNENWNSKFLYYSLANDNFIDYVMSGAKGTKMPRGDKNHIMNYKIREINNKEQKSIAKILSDLDDKIETNNKINKTLEEMAQALFKQWFVDFNFPCLPKEYCSFGARKPEDFEKVLTYNRVGGLPTPDSTSWFVYVLLCEDGSFYKGMTKDLYRRFYEHFTGVGAEWTKTHKPVKVIHYEKFDNQKDAKKREEELKTGYGSEWIKREYNKSLHQSNPPARQTRLVKAGEMIESELGMIPKGWEVKSLDEIADFLNGLAMQKFRPKDDEEVSLPVLKIKELKQGYTNTSSDRCTKDIKKEYIIKNGDVIFAWSGTLCMDIWSGGEAGLNQHLFKVTSKKYEKWFYYLWTKFNLDNFIEIAKDKATTMGHINRKHLTEAKVFVPRTDFLQNSCMILQSIINKMINARKESNELKQIRDTLLPKLMSGEINVG